MKTARWTLGLTGVVLMTLALACENLNPPSAPALSKPAVARDLVLAGGAAATDPAFTTIDVPGATFSQAIDISPSGDIVGRYTSTDGINHGYLLHQGMFTTIDVGQTYTGAMGINSRGDIVGNYLTADSRSHGFLRGADGVTAIDVPGTSAPRPSGSMPGVRSSARTAIRRVPQRRTALILGITDSCWVAAPSARLISRAPP